MDWLRAPSPRLPFPTSLDEIRSQKQQPTVVDQLPVTPTLSYSTSSLNSSPTSTYVEEVSPVKVTPALHTQFNQFEPYAYIQKSVFYSSIENHTIEHQDVEMEPVEQVSSFATSSDMILDSHKMTETNTQWMPPRPASRMQVETQYSENVQSPSFSNDIDIETSAFAPSHQPAPVLGFNVPLAHPDRPVKPLKMRLYNHLRVPFNNPNPPPWTIPSMPMFPSQAFSQPAPVPPSVDMNIEAPHIALPNNFNFNPQVANPVLPPTNVAGPTSVTHPDRPVKAFRRRFLHRRQLHQ
ncbi:hypothetical protein FRC03_005419 [Tulasnella sp. 419]|nr:hypothetical protein FRC03_005419 [Tulasnella sp. 419]